MKIVSSFNHKGGVGKTTIVFNVALALGEMGTRVLLVDGDAQSNLTAIALDPDVTEQVLDEEKTIWSSLAPLVSGAGDLRPIEPIQIRDMVHLVPGDIRLSNFEAICPQGWVESLAGQERGFRVTSAIYRLVREAAAKTEAMIVFLDLGPNVNALNRTNLLGSDGFVVPMAPDLFSIRALPSVGMSAARWIAEWRTALKTRDQKTTDFDLPQGEPRPLGYVSQQFTVYSKQPSEAYQTWMDRIPDAYQKGVVEPLVAVGMHPPAGRDPSMGTLPNFFSLTPIAQEANKAVFELTGSEARGAQYTRAQETRDRFIDLANEVVARLED